ncbi:TPA: hypothetical protein N0F65_008373 [Lagenidium giganteum]|uniref:Endoribonuclease L-PSP/chorismate mutase-like domain-containing protein n=1 Tax=Lagenidium giganteum TaxID=4803 RepID=A0AAV2Z0Z9_9STRA|nr:TPA: hypothetical protein N0F65_008373 [Lagenidium giganteum]
MKIEQRLQELGYELPPFSEPKGNYCVTVRSGNLIFTAGHVPTDKNNELIKGKIGNDLKIEDGYEAAHRAALGLLTTLKAELGDLDKIKRIVKITGFVNCTDDFTAQPAVINGASDTLCNVLGDKGKHARSAVGSNALPLNIAVEVEAIVEVESASSAL